MSNDDIPRQRRSTVRLGVAVALRTSATIVLLFTVYFVLPVNGRTLTDELLWLGVTITAFILIVALQTRWIIRSPYPRLRAIESLAALIPLFLIVFARTYLAMGHYAPGSFSAHLDKVKSIYFTITVFATVGFGDITPTTNPARVLTAVQMLLDLVLLGAAVKLLFGAAERTVSRRQG